MRRISRLGAVVVASIAMVISGGAAQAVTAHHPVITHHPFVVIFMENKSYADILDHAAVVPYEMSFIDQGMRYTDYAQSLAPSLPNYLQLASGSATGCGYTSDKTSAGAVGGAQGCGTTVWNQLESAGISWGVFMEDMPSPCFAKPSTKDLTLDGGTGDAYKLKHNPATPFASIWGDQTLCQAHVLPYSSLNPASLPAVSFIAPGDCDDQHGESTAGFVNCASGSDALYARGDQWLQTNVPAMLNNGATVFITYDGPSSAMYAVEVGSGITPGSLNTTPSSHCSVLAGIENAYGLASLGCASSASPIALP